MTNYASESHPYFIEDGESRKDTAVLLTGTATEFGLDQAGIQATQGGFNVTEEVAKAVYGDDFDADQPEDKNASNQSGGSLEPGTDPIITGSPKDGSATVADPAPVGHEDGAEDGAENDGDASLPDYESWEYNDLKAEVNRRQIEPENQRKETLVAALIVSDNEAESDEDDETL